MEKLAFRALTLEQSLIINRPLSPHLLKPLIRDVTDVRFYLSSFRIGSDIDVQAKRDSDIYNYEYNARLEYGEAVFPPSSILMLKVYIVESISKSLCYVGFGILPIFLEVGTTKQPDIGASQVKVGANDSDDLFVQRVHTYTHIRTCIHIYITYITICREERDSILREESTAVNYQNSFFTTADLMTLAKTSQLRSLNKLNGAT